MKTLFILSWLLWGLTATAGAAAPSAEDSARQFVVSLHRQDFRKAVELFDINMKKAVTADALRALWNRQLQAAGTFQKVTATRSEPLGAYRVVFVTCRFGKRSLDVKVVFDQAKQIAGLFFVPTPGTGDRIPQYVNKESFREMEVQVGHGAWALPGTLSVPNKKGPFPAVVLVHGSGPQDRDETIGPNKPLRDLAWGLSSRGIVVLRYEKRTRQYASKLAQHAEHLTVQEETVDDAWAAVAFLQKNKLVETGRIFVLGHSLGGMLVPRIARNKPGIAGFVMMAANARPMEDLILEQVIYQASLPHVVAADAKARIEAVQRQVASIKNLDQDKVPAHKLLGVPQNYWLDLKGYRPVELAKAIPQPILVMQGEKDCQVSSEKDFNTWRRGLAGKMNVEFKQYRTLNHLFMEVDGKSTGVEYQQPGSVSAAVVRDISDWIAQQEK